MMPDLKAQHNESRYYYRTESPTSIGAIPVHAVFHANRDSQCFDSIVNNFNASKSSVKADILTRALAFNPFTMRKV